MIHTLVTHSGTFHADDLCAAAALAILFPEAGLIRTRDEARLAEFCNDPKVGVFDVGARYEPELNNFDHHQADFDERRDNGVPFSSFGLVWLSFGERIAGRVEGGATEELGITAGELADEVDASFVQGIDAVDNGEMVSRGYLRDRPEVRLPLNTLPSVLDAFNPGESASLEDFDLAFQEALGLVEQIIRHRLRVAVERVRARRLIDAFDDGSPILELDGPLRWKGQTRRHHQFVVYQSEEGIWLAQAVPDPDDPMKPGVPFPQAWAGYRGEELETVSGIEGAVFCHRKRFIAGASSREAILEMVEAAMA